MCGCGGNSPVGGMAATSGDLEDRFIVITPEGEQRAFGGYAEANEYKKETGGRLRARS